MNKRILILVVSISIIILVVVAGFLSYYFDPERTLFNEGQTLKANADYPSAIEKYQTLLDKYPDSEYAYQANRSLAECYYNWGLSLENELKYNEAVEKYQKALSYREKTGGDPGEN